MEKVKLWLIYTGVCLLRYTLNLFNILPVKNNRIVFYSFNGKQYSCNPRYITEYLLENDPQEKYEIIWAFKKPKHYAAILPQRIKTVKYRSINYYLAAKTARVMVFNVQGTGELARRKEQVFVQTWHAGNGYKKIAHCRGIERKLILLGHKDYSYVLSGAESMTERRVRGSMGFKGTVIAGTPRMDMIINGGTEELFGKVYRQLGIRKNKKLLLYAPTWRKDKSRSDFGMDFQRLKTALEARFGGEWVIGVRLHPNVAKAARSTLAYVVDATAYPDMQELLCVADALVSDYSSCVWDFSFTYRPCFLYCSDLEQYLKENEMDIPIEQWGFPVCKDMDDLCGSIRKFNQETFQKSMERHHREMGVLEDGRAAARICGMIQEICR